MSFDLKLTNLLHGSNRLIATGVRWVSLRCNCLDRPTIMSRGALGRAGCNVQATLCTP
jgi:hypothetical protein